MQFTPVNSTEKQIQQLEEELHQLQKKLTELHRSRPHEEIKDYSLQTTNGAVSLRSLFGDKSELILVHNMGKSCPYCTLWADGYNGMLPHLENRAAFAVVSSDDPQVQESFAKERGWKFKMASAKDSTFTKDLGFETDDGSKLPGVSVLVKEPSGKIYRTTRAAFGPGDLFCSIWHFFDLLPQGANGWRPKYKY